MSDRIDLIDGYVTIRAPKDDDTSDTMTLLVGGKKNYKNRREDRWVHGEIVVERNEVVGLAYALWRIIAAEEKKVAHMRRVMKGES